MAGLAVQDLVTILGNLLDNAIDAAADGAGPEAGGADGGVGRRGPGHHCQGFRPGHRPAAVDNIFQHGFSTKAAGPFGRGVGLALVRQAVQRLDGTMTITGTDGAQFHVFLPAMAAGTDKEEQFQ